MGFIATHHAEIMYDSSLINLSVLEECRKTGAKKILYTSSACMYPEHNQLDPSNPKCSEDPDTLIAFTECTTGLVVATAAL